MLFIYEYENCLQDIWLVINYFIKFLKQTYESHDIAPCKYHEYVKYTYISF